MTAGATAGAAKAPANVGWICVPLAAETYGDLG